MFSHEGASFVGDKPAVAMALLTLAVGCNGFIYAGEQSAMLVRCDHVHCNIMYLCICNVDSSPFIWLGSDYSMF